jgi:hypothetical protein
MRWRQIADIPGSDVLSGDWRRQQTLALVVYAVLAALYTHPLLVDVSTHIPGLTEINDEMSDASLQSWYPWWVRTALLDPAKPVGHWLSGPLGTSGTTSITPCNKMT